MGLFWAILGVFVVTLFSVIVSVLVLNASGIKELWQLSKKEKAELRALEEKILKKYGRGGL